MAGCLRPVIVLPAWVLSWQEPLRRMIVAHEREHIRAGDPRLLIAAQAALLLAPWNLALWWQFNRFRQAIEVDCDARVLRGPVCARRYGMLLLEVAGMPRHATIPMAPFGARAGLNRRIRHLTHPRPSTCRASNAALLLIALLAGLSLPALPAPGLPGLAYLDRVALGAGPEETVNVRRPAPVTESGFVPPLPGAPTREQVTEAIRRSHPGLVAGDLLDERAVWFITDQEQRVVETGIERGTEEEIRERIRTRSAAPATGLIFHFAHSLPEGGALRVVWLSPQPGE